MKKIKKILIFLAVFTAIGVAATVITELMDREDKEDTGGMRFIEIANISGYRFVGDYNVDKTSWLCRIENCKEKEITVPAEYKGKPVIAVETDIFSNDTVSSVVIMDGVQFIAGGFNNYSALKEVKFPKSIKAVYRNSFNHCPDLLKAQLPEKTVVEYGAFSEDTDIIIGDLGVYHYCRLIPSKDEILKQTQELLGEELDESKRVSVEEADKFADILNGPLVYMDKCADCRFSEYSREKLPKGYKLQFDNVDLIESKYPETVFTDEKSRQAVDGAKPVVYCLCERIGYKEGPEYIFDKFKRYYMYYRYSFRNASTKELIGWFAGDFGYAPAGFKTGEKITYEYSVGDENKLFFLDEDKHAFSELAYMEKMIYGR